MRLGTGLLLVLVAAGPAPADADRPRITGLSHVGFRVSDLMRTREFYEDTLGYRTIAPPGAIDARSDRLFVPVNDRQYVELRAGLGADQDRLHHIALEIDDVDGMRRYLASRGVAVADRPDCDWASRGAIAVQDPEGHVVELVPRAPAGALAATDPPAAPLSRGLKHAGIVVTDLDAAMAFYGDVLGLVETWRGSRSGRVLSWVNLRAPDGGDYLELMLHAQTPPASARASAHHVCLEVPDVDEAKARLAAWPWSTYSRPLDVRLGTNRKRQLNLYDPDGTRVELMEPQTVDGAPVPSSGAPPPGAERPPVLLDLPVLESPFGVPGGAFPSMRQALLLSKDAYHAVGFLAHRLESKGVWGNLGAIGLEVLAYYLPLGDAWLHEEYHRAVMSRRDIGSFNDVYKFQILAQTVSVSRVRDEDLVRLKLEHPAEQVRLSAAGVEGEHDLLLEVKKDSFFFDAPTGVSVYAWVSQLNGSFYILFSGTSEADELTDELNEEDGADVRRRDFTGLDFTAWVYDLHRPREPYQARGIHPSGVGIDRYRKVSHLTPEERNYLRLQGRLTFLNFVDPALFGIRRFGRPHGLRWTASLRHELTPFGYAIDANTFFRRGRLKIAATARAYSNKDGVRPGIDVQLLRYPLSLGGHPVALTPRLALWLQPKDLLFRSTGSQAGGLLSLRAGIGSRRVQPYVEVEAKTAGWVAGNPYLDSNFTVRAGLTALAFGGSASAR